MITCLEKIAHLAYHASLFVIFCQFLCVQKLLRLCILNFKNRPLFLFYCLTCIIKLILIPLIMIFLSFNNLNNSDDVIRVLAYFQLIKQYIPYNFLILWNFFLAAFDIL